MRASPGAAVKLCLGDLLVMVSNPETASTLPICKGKAAGQKKSKFNSKL